MEPREWAARRRPRCCVDVDVEEEVMGEEEEEEEGESGKWGLDSKEEIREDM